MPVAVDTYCSAPGCSAKVRSGLCREHRAGQQRAYDDRRGSASSRGYDKRWERYRDNFRARYPLCGMRPHEAPRTEDSRCQADDRVTPMHVVDHIRPVSGPDDPDFYNPANHQALCEPCHNRKRQREQKLARRVTTQLAPRVTLVCGPPGAGKSSYVRAHAAPGDLIVDMDRLYHALSGLPMYDKPDALLPYVAAARDAVLERLERSGSLRNAWIVAGSPRASERDAIAARFQATVVLLKCDQTESLKRIKADPDRAESWQDWRGPVERWWRDYEP